MKVDYIVVGSGLAGILFCQRLKENKKTFVVIDDASQTASKVAGGLYNPVILKRFTPVWNAQTQLDLALPIYKQMEKEFDMNLDYKIPIYRLFASIEEQNNWFVAADRPRLNKYLDTTIQRLSNPAIRAAFGYGRVNDTGRIDTIKLIKAFQAQQKSLGQFMDASFDYEGIKIKDTGICYKSIEAKYIVFAEGYGLKQNPYFNHLPLNGTKGELLVIHAPNLNIDFVLKSSVFIIPLGNALYLLGATYEWNDKSNNTTPAAKSELLNKVKSFLQCEFTVEHQIAGIRPTVIDRRPLIGAHKQHKRLFVLNGLGTRGVMIAPYAAKQLYDYIELQKDLDPEVDIRRFSKD
ncbi:MAG: FAD-dependent oxidoreductase [Flavobacteriaceae bacterium]|nr:FAD-dependent oxidoreductase [Flavobacteriaceae bacterium]